MFRRQKAHDVLRPIHDHREEIRDVSAQDAHVERGGIGEGGELGM